MNANLSPVQHSTALAALVFYAMHVADPTLCIDALTALVPHPLRPWDEIISEARYQFQAEATV